MTTEFTSTARQSRPIDAGNKLYVYGGISNAIERKVRSIDPTSAHFIDTIDRK